jgi:hypothetical protein
MRWKREERQAHCARARCGDGGGTRARTRGTGLSEGARIAIIQSGPRIAHYTPTFRAKTTSLTSYARVGTKYDLAPTRA